MTYSSLTIANPAIENFCKVESINQKRSKQAVAGRGKYKIRIKRPGDKIPRTRLKTYHGCRYDTPWIQDLYSNLCDGDRPKHTINITNIENIKLPEYTLYFFDGAGDFDASYGKDELEAVNVNGKEGKALWIGGTNGSTALNWFLKSSIHPLKIHRDRFDLYYFSSSGLTQMHNYTSAKACAKTTSYYQNLLEMLNPNFKRTKWLLMGFSNGAAQVLDFQSVLYGLNENIELLFSLDPVAQPVKFPVASLYKEIGKKGQNTKRLVNIYQQSDFGSLKPLYLRGKPVKNADENILLDPVKHFFNGTGFQDHIELPHTTYVYKASFCEFKSIFEGAPTCDYSTL
jgi:hypothetical protein